MIVSLAELKVQLIGVTGSTYDTILTDLLEAANDMVDRYVGRKIEAAAYIELYNGTGSHELVLDNYPINSVAFITGDLNYDLQQYGDAIDTDDYVIDTDAGILEYISAVWTRGQRNFLVSYNGGFTAANMPEDIKQVIIEIVRDKWQTYREKKSGITNKTVQGETVSYTDPRTIKTEHKEILDRYRNLVRKGGIITSSWGAES